MSNTHSVLKLAEEAYGAYGAATGWKNFQGNEMPEWKDLPDGIKLAWLCAASHIQLKILNSVYDPNQLMVMEAPETLLPAERQRIKDKLIETLSNQSRAIINNPITGLGYSFGRFNRNYGSSKTMDTELKTKLDLGAEQEGNPSSWEDELFKLENNPLGDLTS